MGKHFNPARLQRLMQEVRTVSKRRCEYCGLLRISATAHGNVKYCAKCRVVVHKLQTAMSKGAKCQ